MKIKWLGNACLEIQDKHNILIDPNYLVEPRIDPDIILITHEHSDHIDPQKIGAFSNYKLYAPVSVFQKFDIEGQEVQGGDIITDQIKVIQCDCYGSEQSVCYFWRGLYHTADASTYQTPGGNVKLLFTACFPNLYDEYLQSVKKIQPELTIPYHFNPNDKEKLEEARGLKNYLKENGFKSRLLEMQERITI
ncbi:MAG TPA: MBL fold metallo-hydrolase [bacterium]|nr:MBL fold metallo-hydrolase [bacterium]